MSAADATTAIATPAITPTLRLRGGDHLRPSGHIMPDHAGDRGAVFLVLAPHDHLHISQSRMPDGCAGARRSPRSVAVDEIQQEVGLPPVTVGIRATGVGVTARAGYVR
jgi:hypothetical protein